MLSVAVKVRLFETIIKILNVINHPVSASYVCCYQVVQVNNYVITVKKKKCKCTDISTRMN